MSYTKRQFIEAAYEEIGLASFNYQLTPEEEQFALKRLDAMLAEWNGRGIRLGFPISGNPDDADLDEDTGVKDSANEAIILGLAIKIAPTYGRQVSRETKAGANKSYNTLVNLSAQPIEMSLPRTMPAGAGNKRWRWNDSPFIRQTDRPPEIGPDTYLDEN